MVGLGRRCLLHLYNSLVVAPSAVHYLTKCLVQPPLRCRHTRSNRSISINRGHFCTSTETLAPVIWSNSHNLILRSKGHDSDMAMTPTSVIFLQPSRLMPCILGEDAATMRIVLSVTSSTPVRSKATKLCILERMEREASVSWMHPVRVNRSMRIHDSRQRKWASCISSTTFERFNLRTNRG